MAAASNKLEFLVFLVVVVSMVVTATANKLTAATNNTNNNVGGYYYGGWPTPKRSYSYNCTQNQNPKKIIVGGSENNWTFGFDYTTWAMKNGPFYVNDTLVFKYDAPSNTNIHPHSVYLFDNIKSFRTCDLTKATMLANTSDGAGDGFELKLTQWKPYYFACGGGNGFHCNTGKMKFFVVPLLPRWHY